MKIERINENQIRCTLTSFDLSVRNLNLGELAYGSEKARKLFREMIQKASMRLDLEPEDIPLMVEAIPLSNESVMLVITKVEDPEEIRYPFFQIFRLLAKTEVLRLGQPCHRTFRRSGRYFGFPSRAGIRPGFFP